MIYTYILIQASMSFFVIMFHIQTWHSQGVIFAEIPNQ